MQPKIYWVYVTAASTEEAQRIGETVVQERLAACANVLSNMQSCYWWQGNFERDQEAVLILKTSVQRFPALLERIKQLHSYTVPCVLALPVLEGNLDYLQWVEQETAQEHKQ